MLDPATSVATVFLSPGFWLLLIAAVGLLFALVFGFIDATPRLQRAAFVTAFVACGLGTLLFGGAFYCFEYLWASHVEDLLLCLVLTVTGVLALAGPLVPDAWLGGDTAKQRRRLGFTCLLAFAAIGCVLGLVFNRAPSYNLGTIWGIVRWLWPAGAPGGLSADPWTTTVSTALLNSIFFGAFGGVIGTVFSIVLGSKAPIAITIAVLLAGLILWRNLFPHPPTRNPTTCESFVAGVAMDFSYPDLCRKIPFEAAEAGAPKGLAVTSLRSRCFQALAFNTGNDSLCSEVKPIRGFGPYDGSVDEFHCVDRVLHSRNSWRERGLYIPGDQLAPLMRQLGYTNQTLEDAHIYPQDNSAWARYIDILRPPPSLPGIDASTDPQQPARLDFLSRIMNLQCKSE